MERDHLGLKLFNEQKAKRIVRVRLILSNLSSYVSSNDQIVRRNMNPILISLPPLSTTVGKSS